MKRTVKMLCAIGLTLLVGVGVFHYAEAKEWSGGDVVDVDHPFADSFGKFVDQLFDYMEGEGQRKLSNLEDVAGESRWQDVGHLRRLRDATSVVPSLENLVTSFEPVTKESVNAEGNEKGNSAVDTSVVTESKPVAKEDGSTATTQTVTTEKGPTDLSQDETHGSAEDMMSGILTNGIFLGAVEMLFPKVLSVLKTFVEDSDTRMTISEEEHKLVLLEVEDFYKMSTSVDESPQMGQRTRNLANNYSTITRWIEANSDSSSSDVHVTKDEAVLLTRAAALEALTKDEQKSCMQALKRCFHMDTLPEWTADWVQLARSSTDAEGGVRNAFVDAFVGAVEHDIALEEELTKILATSQEQEDASLDGIVKAVYGEKDPEADVRKVFEALRKPEELKKIDNWDVVIGRMAESSNAMSGRVREYMIIVLCEMMSTVQEYPNIFLARLFFATKQKEAALNALKNNNVEELAIEFGENLGFGIGHRIVEFSEVLQEMRVRAEKKTPASTDVDVKNVLEKALKDDDFELHYMKDHALCFPLSALDKIPGDMDKVVNIVTALKAKFNDGKTNDAVNIIEVMHDFTSAMFQKFIGEKAAHEFFESVKETVQSLFNESKTGDKSANNNHTDLTNHVMAFLKNVDSNGTGNSKTVTAPEP